MKCRCCGKQLNVKVDFCPNCGEPISDEEWDAWEQSETKQAKPDPVKKIPAITPGLRAEAQDRKRR